MNHPKAPTDTAVAERGGEILSLVLDDGNSRGTPVDLSRLESSPSPLWLLLGIAAGAGVVAALANNKDFKRWLNSILQ